MDRESEESYHCRSFVDLENKGIAFRTQRERCMQHSLVVDITDEDRFASTL